MAKVNRFYKQPTRRLINPLSMQEMAYAPTMLRQQHDKVLAAAAENFVLDADTLAQDQAAARQALSPIEEASTQLASDLAKNGYSPEKFAKMMQIESQKRQVERDVTSKITARKQQIQGKLAEISEKYKDNVRVRDAIIDQFLYLNQEGATLEDGKLNMPGMRTPFMAEYMSDEKLQEMVTDGISKLKANARAIMGDQTKALPNDVVGIISTLEKQEGVSRERITKLLQTSLGNDVLDRFRMDATVSGIGLSSVSNDPRDLARDSAAFKEAINNEINNLHKTLYADEINRRASREDEGTYSPSTEERQQIYNEIAKGETFKRAKDQIIQGYRQQVEQNPQSIGKLVVDKFAQNALNEYILGMSDAFAYSKTEDGRELGFQQFRDTSTNKIDVPGFQSVDVEYANTEAPFGINTDGIGLDASGDISFVGDSVDLQNKFLIERGWNPDELSTLDRKDILEGKYKNDFQKFKDKNQKDIQTIKGIKETVPYFKNMDNETFLNTVEQYKEASKSFITSGVFAPKDAGKTFRRNYLGSRDGQGNVVLPKNVNTSTYSLNDGDADITLTNVADKLGYGDVNEFIQTGGFSQATFVPNIGKWVATAVDSDGKPQNIFISPSKEIGRMAQPSRDITNAITSMAPITKLPSQSSTMNAYLLNDYQNNEPYIIYSSENIDPKSEDSYTKLLNIKNKALGRAGFGAEDNRTVVRAVDVLSKRASKMIQTETFQDNLDLE